MTARPFSSLLLRSLCRPTHRGLLAGHSLFAVLVPLSAADTPGAPSQPVPDHATPGYVLWANDGFAGAGAGSVPDDFRSNRIAGGLRFDDWLLVLDHSLLTDRNPTGAPPRWGPAVPDPFAEGRAGAQRSDEATATLSWLAEGGQVVRYPWTFAIGGGLRARGDLGGEAVQNLTHAIFGDQRLDLPQERSGIAVTPVAVAAAGALLPLGLDTSPLGLWVQADGLVSGTGEVQGALDARLTLRGSAGAVWTGMRQVLRGGDPDSNVATAVARHEAGRWLMLGLYARPLVAAFSTNPGTGAVEGRVTYAAGGPYILPQSLDIDASLGAEALSPDHGRSVRYRLAFRSPLQRDGSFLDRALWPVLTYRAFALDSPQVYDLSSTTRDLLAGVEFVPLEAAAPNAGWSWSPVVSAAIGWRDARLRNLGRQAFCDDAHVATPLWAAGAGLRGGYDPEPGRWPGIGASVMAEWIEPLTTLRRDYRRIDADGIERGAPGEIPVSTRGLAIILALSARIGW